MNKQRWCLDSSVASPIWKDSLNFQRTLECTRIISKEMHNVEMSQTEWCNVNSIYIGNSASREEAIFGKVWWHGLVKNTVKYEVCSENNGKFLISRVWRVLLSKFFFMMLVYMPLKYDKIFSYIHYLLCLWQPLRLDVFLWVRRFSFVKRNRSTNLYQILRKKWNKV